MRHKTHQSRDVEEIAPNGPRSTRPAWLHSPLHYIFIFVRPLSCDFALLPNASHSSLSATIGNAGNPYNYKMEEYFGLKGFLEYSDILTSPVYSFACA